jgi:hypothetical protein
MSREKEILTRKKDGSTEDTEGELGVIEGRKDFDAEKRRKHGRHGKEE